MLFLTQGRASLTHEKQRFAHEHREMKNLEDIVKDIKPTVLIGNFFDFKAMTLFFVEKKMGMWLCLKRRSSSFEQSLPLCVFRKHWVYNALY